MVQIREQLMIETMREADVPAVQIIERDIFSTPWPRNAYYRELASRYSAHYIVLRKQGGPRGEGTRPWPARPALGSGGSPPETDDDIVGYAGMWRMYDEAHVTTIGVRQDMQHSGY